MNVDADLLAAPGDNLVSVHYVLGAWRRRRRLIAGLAAVGIVVGIVLGGVVPHPRSATTDLLLQYPSGADPTRAIATDVSLLQTRAVADAAEKSLGLHEPAASFQASYHGTILSDQVLQISVKADNATEAVRRGDALSRAFLRFRKSTYDYQLSVVDNVLHRRETALQGELAATNDQIAAFDSNAANAADTAAPGASSLSDLLTQRAGQTSAIQEIENEIQGNVVATSTVVDGSHVIDSAVAVAVSTRKTLLLDVAAALVGAVAIGLGGVTLVAIVSLRVVRRADIAAALQAPVLVSVGRLGPPAWLRVARHVPGWSAAEGALSREPHPEALDDVRLVVRHMYTLMRTSTAQPPALVVVAIGSGDVAATTVGLLLARFVEDGQGVALVNETGRPLPPLAVDGREADAEPAPGGPTAAAGAAGGGNGGGTAGGTGGAAASDAVVVLAVLDPAKGAEHLREWASDAVVMVTAGRSRATTLQSNAAMIRAAGLRLRSVVLLESDPSDDSLGTFDAPTPDPPPPKRVTKRTAKVKAT